MLEPQPPGMAGPFLGVDDTKEFLSFERQPSFFKGRNQSWFHPLRTPSRPGAAAPGPHGGSGPSLVLSHAIYRPRCTDRQLLGDEGLLSSYYFLRITQGPFHQGIPAPDPVPAFTPESRRPTLTVIPTELP